MPRRGIPPCSTRGPRSSSSARPPSTSARWRSSPTTWPRSRRRKLARVSAPTTWHHGLVAEWWALFNTTGDEIAHYRRLVEAGQPALDAGCGAGRLLVPWLEAGLDVDGCDASADMIERCRERARSSGLEPTLFVQPLHELDAPRRYRTIVACGVFGLGTTRAQDEEAIRRLHAALEPGGTLVLDNEVPYSSARRWARWTSEGRGDLPRPWPDEP